MNRHRELLRKNGDQTDRALAVVAEDVRAQAMLATPEVAAELVQRARRAKLLSSRTEVDSAVAALLAYATQGLDTLRSARSRLRTIVAFALANDATIPDLTARYGGLWKIYDEAPRRDANAKAKAAVARLISVRLPQAVEERARERHSVIQLVPASRGHWGYREIVIYESVQDDKGEQSRPASLPEHLSDVGEARASSIALNEAAGSQPRDADQPVDDAVEISQDPSPGTMTDEQAGGVGVTAQSITPSDDATAELAVSAVRVGEGTEAVGEVGPRIIDPTAQIDLLGASKAEAPPATSGEESGAAGIVSSEGLGDETTTAPDDLVTRMQSFCGTPFIINSLKLHQERFEDLMRCATSERMQLRGFNKPRHVWTAHTMTPLLAETLQQHGARPVRDDEIVAAG
ncbi:hypothetical protein J8J14_23845 [Roseomonas sp. SSH11]|uniref:DUF222 domain-containing protein n=1 Tax=Pararoseomonas baculiformis TaxID=2820812 RepID=A0ABS4AL86_9PROT|nr:hypothetical protein [Pararoseomonas baculiformis]MBP0447783.1 hypothetical protein [Pararoseomonas baculiformis]